MNERPTAAPRPVTRRSTVVRHLLMSAALWATYVIYWKIVVERGVQREATISFALLGLFVLLQILFTQAWILHNRRLSAPARNRRKARVAPAAVPETDFLGRRLSRWPPGADLTRTPCIVVRVDGPEKRFETGLHLDDSDEEERGGAR